MKCLRGELQQVREDRDRQVTQVQALTSDVVKYKESTGESCAKLEYLMEKTKSLEVCSYWPSYSAFYSLFSKYSKIKVLLQETCSSQREQICLLEHQLTAANEKLKVMEVVNLGH